jgi:bacterioferritin-associated ferredoxin
MIQNDPRESSMYLCLCHAITDDQATWAVRELGADSAEAVFEALGARPDCRRCLDFMEDAVLTIRAGESVQARMEDPLANPWACGGRCRPVWGTPAPALRAAS